MTDSTSNDTTASTEPRTLVSVPFYHSEVLATEVDGKVWIAFRPVIESMGLDFSAQFRRVNGYQWGRNGVTAMQARLSNGHSREMMMITPRALAMVLVTISETRVDPSIRPLLNAYQNEIADVVEAYMTGMKIPDNPRIQVEQTYEAQLTIKERMGLLTEAAHLPDDLRELAIDQLREAFRAPQSREEIPVKRESTPVHKVPNPRGRMRGISW
jgi:P22_AR N-terminal domain.